AIADTTLETAAVISEFTSTPKEDDGFLETEWATYTRGPNTGTTTLDFTNPGLREVTGAEIDLSTYSVRWTESDVGARGDAVWVEIGQFTADRWFVMAPRTDATALRLPILPISDTRLDVNARINNFAVVSADGGYAAMRSYLLGHWTPQNGNWWP